VAQANVKLTVDASQATRALQGVQNRTTKLNGGLNRIKTAIAGIGLTVLARQAVNTSANFAKLNVRLGLLTKASGTFARSQEIAAEAQKSFGLSATEALEGITNITARLQPLGVAVEDIRTTFIGFNTAAKLAGASAMESSNAFRQLAQALGSGRLQGDEFRSIAEQVPTLLAPIAKELNTTVGGLKKFASEGKLTSDVVIRALKKVELDGAASLKALLENDPTQVFKDLGNEAENLSRAFGDLLAPAVLPVIRGITDLTSAVTAFLNSPIGTTAAIFTGIAVAAKGIAVVLPIAGSAIAFVNAKIVILTSSLMGLKIALAGLGIGALVLLVGGLTTAFIKNKKEAKENADAIKAFNEQIGITVDEGGEVAEIIAEITKKQRELNAERRKGIKRRLESEIEELELNKEILEGEKDRIKLEADMKKFNDKTIKLLKQQNALEQKLSGKKEEQITLEDQINEIKKEYTGEDAKQLIGLTKTIDELKKKNEELDKSKKKAEELRQKFMDIGEEIEGSIKNNLRDAITGAQSFGQAMTNVLNRIRDKIIDAQIDKLIGGFGEAFGAGASGGERKGIGGFLGGLLGGLFANGGQPPVNKISVVGERGPELFVPKTAGTIIPNSAIGGGGTTTNNMITVNVDATGSSVQGNGSEADQLGGLIASVVQATIIDEQRAGGLLNR
jgi:tape measure domain-containing protein